MLEADLLGFVKGSIRSTWALELLLLLRKAAPKRYSAQSLVLELRATEMLIAGCLEQLQTAGLIVCDDNGECRYEPASPALAEICDALAEAYEQRPVAIISAIAASPNERLQIFADAFRFKRKDQ